MSIEPLDDEALLSKEVAGSWAIADVLTNITSWESELVTGLMKLDQKKQPEKLLAALADPDVYDQAHYDALQDRDLDQIFEDLQQVRIQLEDWLSEFSEQDLANPKRYRSLNGRSLRSIIAEATFQREEKFLPAIESFSQAWLSEADRTRDDMIMLTTIETLSEEEDDDGAN